MPSMTIIVSEETGKVSVAYKGELYRSLDVVELRKKLELAQDKKKVEKNIIAKTKKERKKKGKKDEEEASKELGS